MSQNRPDLFGALLQYVKENYDQLTTERHIFANLPEPPSRSGDYKEDSKKFREMLHKDGYTDANGKFILSKFNL